MARKKHENPQLDMTPMIDVVFELIIFFVVTLTQATAKDETVKLEDGKHGIELTPDGMTDFSGSYEDFLARKKEQAAT